MRLRALAYLGEGTLPEFEIAPSVALPEAALPEAAPLEAAPLEAAPLEAVAPASNLELQRQIAQAIASFDKSTLPGTPAFSGTVIAQDSEGGTITAINPVLTDSRGWPLYSYYPHVAAQMHDRLQAYYEPIKDIVPGIVSPREFAIIETSRQAHPHTEAHNPTALEVSLLRDFLNQSALVAVRGGTVNPYANPETQAAIARGAAAAMSRWQATQQDEGFFGGLPVLQIASLIARAEFGFSPFNFLSSTFGADMALADIGFDPFDFDFGGADIGFDPFVYEPSADIGFDPDPGFEGSSVSYEPDPGFEGPGEGYEPDPGFERPGEGYEPDPGFEGPGETSIPGTSQIFRTATNELFKYSLGQVLGPRGPQAALVPQRIYGSNGATPAQVHAAFNAPVQAPIVRLLGDRVQLTRGGATGAPRSGLTTNAVADTIKANIVPLAVALGLGAILAHRTRRR